MIAKTAGWITIVVSVVVLVVFAAIRSTDMATNPTGTDAFGIRYVQHPSLALLHIIPGLLFQQEVC